MEKQRKEEIAYQVLKYQTRQELHLDPDQLRELLRETSQGTGIPLPDLRAFTKETLHEVINEVFQAL